MTPPWLQTYTLRAFDLLAPTADMVAVEDIAHALSRINRFNGHTHGEPYSVAHHSMLVADLLASWGCPVAVVRDGLLHDAPEAYYGDLVSPMHAAIRAQHESREGDPWRRVTEPIDAVVRAALSLPERETPIVKRADLVALAIERRDLFGGGEEPRDWMLPEFAPLIAPCGRLHGYSDVPAVTDYAAINAARLCSWSAARARFAAYLVELDAQIGGAR